MMNRSLVFVLILFSVLFLFAACGNSKKADTADFQDARTFDLSEIKEAELSLNKSFSIGSYGTVNDIGAVAADDQGFVFVVNSYNKKIEVFDRTGDHIESLGGLGSDPGDYRNPVFMKVQGDHLFTFDNSLHRVYKYKLSDRELRSVTELDNAISQFGIDSLRSAKPVMLEVTADENYLVGFQVVRSTEDRRLIYYKIDENGQILSNQLFSVSNRNLHVDRTVDPPLIMMLPYEPEVLIRTDTQGRILKIDTDHFLIILMDSKSEEIESRYYPFEKHDLIRSEVLEMYTDTFRRRAIRRASLPDTWPALSHILMDDQDRLWAASIVSDPDIYRWFIIAPSGQPLATFELSRKKKIEAIRGETVYIKSFNASRLSDEVKRYTLKF
ncbi:6-bladed beta-propeller [Gracilimonas sp. Q87]|uniref:6-bladed beta-propeller n=1 Tax=Gracilimonas sp. Q87 TaxID=3384766 RepID=UPI0039843125